MNERSAKQALRAPFGRSHGHWITAAFVSLVTLALGACDIPGPQTSEEQMAKLPRKSLGLAKYALSYLEAGETDGRLVVFVHGTPGSADGWADYLMHVPPGFRYIAVDRPGFGQSGPEDAVVSLPEQARALAAVIRAQPTKRVILVGHSLGGPIIAQLAVDEPDLVSALVILAGSLDPGQENVPFIQYVGDTWPVNSMLSRTMRNANRELIALEPELERLAPRLAQITAPVVIVHGTKDDLVPFANVAFIKAHMTGAKKIDVTVMEGQNHFLPWNAKKQVDAAIAKAAELVDRQ